MSNTATSQSDSLQHAHQGHGADGHANPEGSEVFTTLLNSLGDHHELNIFFGHYKILPVMLVDNGFHVYPNVDAMEHAGAFTMHHPGHGHHIVKAHELHTETEADACSLKDVGASPSLDLSITNFVAYEFIAILIATIVFGIARGRYIKNALQAPKGLQNVVESLVLYVRDEIVRPNVGTEARAHRLMPYILGIFFFVLTLNLVGLMPGCHAATGALGVTAALALTTFIVVNFVAIKDAGIKSWLHHLLGGAPWYMFPIMVPIEIISLFTKPFALMIRLFANMTAGHIVLLSLVGLIFFFKSWMVTPVSVAFSVFIYLLELLVAFLQAYIFAMLASVFVGLALGDHAHDDHHGDAHAH